MRLNEKWQVGAKDRGMGAYSFAVITEGGGYGVSFRCPKCETTHTYAYPAEGTCVGCDEVMDDIIESLEDEELGKRLELVRLPGGDMVLECATLELAEHIVDLHNKALGEEK